jgi:hypothetical protein
MSNLGGMDNKDNYNYLIKEGMQDLIQLRFSKK